MKSSTGLCTPLFVHSYERVDVFGRSLCCIAAGSVSPRTALGHRIPTSRVPGGAFEQASDSEDRAFDCTVGLQRIDGVLTAGGDESAGRQPKRRHIIAVQLDREDKCSYRERTNELEKAHLRCIFRRSGAGCIQVAHLLQSGPDLTMQFFRRQYRSSW